MNKLQTEWFNAIKKNIYTKYNIEKPEFLIDDEKLNEIELDKWLSKYITPPIYWMKYKKLQDNQFELKPFSPDPDDNISTSIIKEYLSNLSTDKKTWYTVNYNDAYENILIEGDSWYDNSEIETELLYLCRIGQSKISSHKDPTKNDKAIVYHLFIEQDSIEKMLNTEYLKLEYKD
jgi:hypothetical protein